MTLDMEDHTTTDSTLEILAKLRQDYPTTGAVLQAYLRRTEADCRELATPGSRVRLCKGAYKEPESVAFQSAIDVDKSYVRCMNILMSGEGYPMLATHDPRLIAIGEDRARWFDRSPDEFEFQLLLRRASRGAAAAGRRGLHGAGLRALRQRVVRLHDAPPRRTSGEPAVLRPRHEVAQVTRPYG